MTDKEIKKLIENIHADFRRRLNADKWAQHIIREGKAAGMNDVALLAKQLGYHLSASVEWFTKDADLPFGDEQMEQIARDILQPLLKDNYDLINKAFDDAQRRLDEARGINMEPLHAKFPQERADSIYSSAADPLAKVETIRRRLKGPAETLTNSMSDRNMKKNAVERNKAGFETYITRIDDGNCCPWCAKNAGRYEYPDKTPRDVFRRHDNCGCKVVYECGNMRQDVHSKRTWEQPTGTEQELTRNPNVTEKPLGRNPDVKQKDLRIMGNKKALTEGSESDIIESKEKRAIIDAFTNMTNSDDIVDAVIENHMGLGEFTPKSMKEMLEKAGYEPKPLTKSSTWKNIPFEQGGGYKINFGGDAYFQYHPKEGSHHGQRAYWRVSNGKRGKDNRYNMDGTKYFGN